MKYRNLNYLFASFVFTVSLVSYILTLPPTIVFWDVAEFCASAFLLQIEHSPGAPFLMILARVASMIPLFQDIAMRMHFISAISAAAISTLLYVIAVRMILQWKEIPKTIFECFAVYGSMTVGALSLTFSKSFWFNAVEAEVFALSMFLVSIILWLGLKWYEREEKDTGDIYILMIAYILGISVGVRLLAVLAFFPIMFFWYFRNNRSFEIMSFLKFGIAAVFIFLFIYPFTANIIPSLFNGSFAGMKSPVISYFPFVFVISALFGVYYSIRKKNRILNITLLSFLLIVLGVSTYTTVYIRARAHPPINSNDPSTPERFVDYLNREQYDKPDFFNRRFETDYIKMQYHKKYSSDFDFLWRFQSNHMYWRYLGWNYIGTEGDFKDAGVDWNQFYLVPFLLGLLGAWYQWRRQPRMAFIMSLMFIILGIVLALYQNQQEPQARERDYFYIGSFFVFSFWIGYGVLALIDILKRKIASKRIAQISGYCMIALAFLFVPIKMFKTNYPQQNRKGNYVAWDYSYDVLQSCGKDAILITNGDNDTYPLWYLQDVEGIRRDIRVVNLPLTNMPWYIKQLKNKSPYGTKEVPISISDIDIEKIAPIPFEPKWMQLPVSPGVIQQFTKEGITGLPLPDTSVTKSGVIRYLMSNIKQFGDSKSIRVQDIILFDIISSNNWQRPIHFAMTVQPDAKIGLQDYLQLTGLTFRLSPFKAQNYWANLNETVLRKHLFTDIKKYSKEPQYGFLWRGLQDSTVYYDEDTRNMLSTNYRILFISYALHYANIKKQPQEMSAILNRMEQVFPRRSVPMDYRVKYDVAALYNFAGDKEKNSEFLLEVVHDIDQIIDKLGREQLSPYNPYIILFRSYEKLGMYKNAEDLILRIKYTYKDQDGINGVIAQLKDELQMNRNSPASAQQLQKK